MQQSTLEEALNSNHSADWDAPTPEEIAGIYAEPDFVAFRQRCLDGVELLGIYEKSSRPAIRTKIGNGCGPQSLDQRRLARRRMNDQAAKRSRDAENQMHIEKMIKVNYLIIKTKQLQERKRRLLQGEDC